MVTEEQENEHLHGTPNSERRKHPRFTVELPVEYYKLGSIVKHEGKAVNASQGGLLLYFSEPLPIGLYLRLKLLLHSGTELKIRVYVSKEEYGLDSIEGSGKIIWRTLHHETGWKGFKYGLYLTEMASEDRERLAQLLTVQQEGDS